MAHDDATTVGIRSGRVSADIALRGAELVRLRDEAGRDLLWDGDPAFWTGRSPILFPIVGRLKDDRLTRDGVDYPMRQHGVARSSSFELVSHDDDACRLRLSATEATLQAYPFRFDLDLVYRIEGASLHIEGVVHNPGPGPMPVSFGYHPAFRWPLPYGADASDHAIVFEADEPAPLAVLDDGLLASRTRPTPVQGRTLALRPGLFQADALIFLSPASRSVQYGPPGGRGLRIDFPAMPQLGIWSKPGAPFVCVEPWSGYASPADFRGDITEKPGMVAIAPGDTRVFAISITLTGP